MSENTKFSERETLRKHYVIGTNRHITYVGEHEVPGDVIRTNRIFPRMGYPNKSDLPYDLPRKRVRDLMTYVVGQMHFRRTVVLNHNVCPRVRFTRMKVRYKK